METRRLILFMVISVAILFGWQKLEESRRPPKPAVATNQAGTTQPAEKVADISGSESAKLTSSGRLKVTTDLMQLEIDAMGGDIRKVALLKHGDASDPKKPFTLLEDGDRVYIAQTGLMSSALPNLPTHRTQFKLPESEVKLAEGQDALTIRLEAPELGGVKIAKIFTLKRGSYVIDVDYEITNGSAAPINMSAYYRLLRDGQPPVGDPKMLHTFTGPAIYTEQKKFQKVEFSDIEKGKATDKYVAACDNGWIGIIQHYFTAVWLPKPATQQVAASCDGKTDLRYDLKKVGNLYSVGVIRDVPAVAPGQTVKTSMPLFAGPIETAMVSKLAPGLELTKDYGIFKVIASPLFWLLEKLHGLVGNWGWAIILLTVVVKAILYPLSAASYRSMAQMKALAPRLERLKEQFGDDRQKMHQAMMELYKTEKINPLGGCLPMLLQMPIFMALYWVLVAAVELRFAPFMGWVTDLSATDPYFIWPLLLAISMVVQTYMSPQPTDPMQAKMQKIMPIAFSVMFFFMPVGLVLYWLVNNLLTIAQQKFVERQFAQSKKAT
ncbi:YidC/Oxa1 family membrane protein insertase [Chitinivorax tropicus]|uniref:Membrane protein insertase YidC n=1 Tax=Chitinivorax tropicus TaxID=714531 RepID=A0A840MTX1_9PROT|nr:membrane protein insertase YidC [Chitinivorax tropicus]MBB5020242.1 YidC/Oxa1 family membrane protein insertase [Chitinivorax tropicus]